MHRFRSRESRKVAELARLLVALDDEARAVRPAAKLRARVSLGVSR
jgi:hypothetical protein